MRFCVEGPTRQAVWCWGGLKSRYKYLSVSANQKDCILLSCAGGITPTSVTPLYPPLATCMQVHTHVIWPVTSSRSQVPSSLAPQDIGIHCKWDSFIPAIYGMQG